MRSRNPHIVVACMVLAVIAVSCTIVRHDNASKEAQREIGDLSLRASTFDPVQYAEMIWEPVVLPRIESLSVDFNELMIGLNADEEGTSRRYGFRLLEEGNRFNFAVQGQVRLLSVDTSSANGLVTVDFYPFTGQADALMSIGPVFRGSAIRDIQNSFSLNDFTNQTEFARLARELNFKVRDVVLQGIDFEQLVGSQAEILGVFDYHGRDRDIEIIPVRLTINQ